MSEALELLRTIVITVVTLGVLVSIHEFGHFWVARKCGVKVLRFCIGFGQPLWKRIGKDGTEYVIAAIPLGGYVKMLGEQDEDFNSNEAHLAFSQKSVWQRMAIVVAGPLANFLLAIFAFWLVFMAGVTKVAPVVGEVLVGGPAEKAGFVSGQEIVSVDGTKTDSWKDVSMALLARVGETGVLRFTVKYPDSDITYDNDLAISEWQGGDAPNPDFIDALGITPFYPDILPIVAGVLPGSPAEKAGLEVGDYLLEADGLAVEQWQDWVDYVKARAGVEVALLVRRGSEHVRLLVTPERKEAKDGTVYGLVGVQAQAAEWPKGMLREVSYSPWGAMQTAVLETWRLSVFTLDSVKKMLLGLISPKNLSGPITIAKVASSSASYGFQSYLGFLALLSISLGVLNLLPIPVLDGGHLLFYIIEVVKGSPVSDKVQAAALQMGMSIVLVIMLFALYNDFSRL
jgi:regulator of sigma E protease